MEITTVVKSAWDMFTAKIMAFLPMLIGAIIIFVVGLVLAKFLRLVVTKLLKVIRFDDASEKTGLKNFLEKGNITKSASDIIGALIYWFIMILVLIAALEALGLPIVSDILNDIFLYIPNVLAAIIVLILGILFGNVLSAIVQTTASNAGLSFAETFGKIALYAIIIFSVSVALIQLGIGEEIIGYAFIIVFGSVALALALAFGLGGKEAAADYIKKWLEGKKASDE